jgi:hypothetical protein
MITETFRLRGHRAEDSALLTGHWQPGELLASWQESRPALAEPISIPPEEGRLYLVENLAFVRFVEVDWVHRRARLEIGVQQGVADADLVGMLRAAVAHGFGPLNLHRLHGCVTPAAGTSTLPVAEAGFELEAVVPQATWLDGAPADQQLWGVLRNA